MAAGKQAFTGSTSAAVFDGILHNNPTPMRQLNPSLPAGLDQTISRLMEKDPDLRYQTAADLRSDLKRLLRDTSSAHAIAQTAATPAATGQKPFPRWAILVVIVAIAGIAGVVRLHPHKTFPRSSDRSSHCHGTGSTIRRQHLTTGSRRTNTTNHKSR